MGGINKGRFKRKRRGPRRGKEFTAKEKEEKQMDQDLKNLGSRGGLKRGKRNQKVWSLSRNKKGLYKEERNRGGGEGDSDSIITDL